jgi:hypothetical protein
MSAFCAAGSKHPLSVCYGIPEGVSSRETSKSALTVHLGRFHILEERNSMTNYMKPSVSVIGDACLIIQGVKSTIAQQEPDKVELTSWYDPEE